MWILPLHRLSVSQTYSIQDKYQKLCNSRYQEQRNKLGTLCTKKILIKIELVQCIDSATLLIVILTVMQVRNEKAEPEAIHIPGTDRPSAGSVVAGDRQRCLWRGAPGVPPALSGLPPLPSAAQPRLAQGPDADSQFACGNLMKADAWPSSFTQHPRAGA